MRKMRVAIVEPSTIIAEGMASLVGRGGEFEIVYAGGDVRLLAERFAVVEPDLVIVGSQAVGGVTLRTMYPELQDVALVTG